MEFEEIHVILWTVNDMQEYGVQGADKFVESLCSDSHHSDCRFYIGCRKYAGHKFEKCKAIRVIFKREYSRDITFICGFCNKKIRHNESKMEENNRYYHEACHVEKIEANWGRKSEN